MDTWRGVERLLTEKYSDHTNWARRACHEKLVDTKIRIPARISDDLFFVLDECRDLEEMGQTVHDER